MKTNIALFFCAAVLALPLIAGCNKPAEISGTQASTAETPHLSDSEVNQAVRSVLLQDKNLMGFGITAVTTKGDVLLKGEVDNQRQIDYADQLVLGIAGVHTIHNHLSIKKQD